MKPHRVLLSVSALLVLGAGALAAQAGSEADQRITAAVLLGLGYAPDAGEIAEWKKNGVTEVEDILVVVREHNFREAAASMMVEVRAYRDALGRDPTEAEAEARSQGDATYAARVQRLIDRLAANPAEYEAVIQRAYQWVIRREAYDEEIKYWQEKPTLSYVLLVGCVEDWARRNQPGLMVTAGTPTISINSDFLTAVRLSPAIASEARSAMGLEPAGPGMHVVAPGAANVVSGGGVHFIAVGGGSLGSMPAAR